MNKLEQDIASNVAEFHSSPGERFIVKSEKPRKEYYGPFTMIGKIKDTSSRKLYDDLFDILSNVTNSAVLKLFTLIIHNRDEKTNIAVMSIWEDLSTEERKTNQKKLIKLIKGNLIIRIPVGLKLPIQVTKFTYMINPYYYRPLNYEESKVLWDTITSRKGVTL